MSCFQGLFFCPQAASLLLHNFCIYHIYPPGHEVRKCFHFIPISFCVFIQQYTYGFLSRFVFFQLGAAPISSDIPIPSVDDLADQVAEVLDFFG